MTSVAAYGGLTAGLPREAYRFFQRFSLQFVSFKQAMPAYGGGYLGVGRTYSLQGKLGAC